MNIGAVKYVCIHSAYRYTDFQAPFDEPSYYINWQDINPTDIFQWLLEHQPSTVNRGMDAFDE